MATEIEGDLIDGKILVINSQRVDVIRHMNGGCRIFADPTVPLGALYLMDPEQVEKLKDSIQEFHNTNDPE